MPLTAYKISSDSIVLSTSISNPIEKLSVNTLKDIFTGTITTFSDLIDTCDDCTLSKYDEKMQAESIRIWIYPKELPIQTAIQTAFHFIAPSAKTMIAPNPSLMMQALTIDKNSIGFLPSKFTDEQIKTIEIIDGKINSAEIPIIAYSNSSVDNILTGFLLCIQSKLK